MNTVSVNPGIPDAIDAETGTCIDVNFNLSPFYSLTFNSIDSKSNVTR